MTEEEILNKCKERFAAHKATLIQDTDRYMIIDWRKADGSIDYYVNYILDKKKRKSDNKRRLGRLHCNVVQCGQSQTNEKLS